MEIDRARFSENSFATRGRQACVPWDRWGEMDGRTDGQTDRSKQEAGRQAGRPRQTELNRE
jgi:hypothetical protein